MRHFELLKVSYLARKYSICVFTLCSFSAGQRDDAWAGSDLMEHFQLMRLYKFSQTDLVPTNYLKGVPGDTTLWR